MVGKVLGKVDAKHDSSIHLGSSRPFIFVSLWDIGLNDVKDNDYIGYK